MIQAILFDSGKVLNYPTSGHWFISPCFFDIVNRKAFEKLERGAVQNAFDKARQYVEEISVIQNKEEEYQHFHRFYQIFSQELPVLGLTEQDICALAVDMVHNLEKYTFYTDALQIIPKLYGKYKLGIVSDAWPSLLDVYENVGMKQYFSTMVISSQIGSHKPERKMYQTALDELAVQPDEAVFVDDSIENCKGAARLHIKSYWLCRGGKPKWWHMVYARCLRCKVICSLEELYVELAGL